MANAGSVPIQGCALRVTSLNFDGSCILGSSSTVQDDKPFIKFTAKPAVEAGVELNPKSACGDLLIAYKDFDRIKRWDWTLDFGDYDFDKMEILGGGSLITAASSSGRTVSSTTTLNSATITSATLFLPTDVGRTITGTGIPAASWIVEFLSTSAVVINTAATASGTVTLTLGTLAARSIGYQWPQLLIPSNPYGVSIEIWQKAMVRGTGFQGSTPYPSAGSHGTATDIGPSAWVRFGAFRCIPKHDAIDIEDKESTQMFVGWALENPNFGTGPLHDWTTTAAAGGPPVDTTRWANAMMDFALPTPLGPGFFTTS